MKKLCLACTITFGMLFCTGCLNEKISVPSNQTVIEKGMTSTPNAENTVLHPEAYQAGQLDISFNFKRGTPSASEKNAASSQYAVWIEDDSGKLIKTLYVTKFTATGGYAKRGESIPVWVSKANPAKLGSSAIDAVSGATPVNGPQTYSWDGRNASGNTVPVGTYRFFVEGSYNWSSHVMFSGSFTVGDKTQSDITVEAEYNDQENQNRDMISNVNAKYIVLK